MLFWSFMLLLFLSATEEWCMWLFPDFSLLPLLSLCLIAVFEMASPALCIMYIAHYRDAYPQPQPPYIHFRFYVHTQNHIYCLGPFRVHSHAQIVHEKTSEVLNCYFSVVLVWMFTQCTVQGLTVFDGKGIVCDAQPNLEVAYYSVLLQFLLI